MLTVVNCRFQTCKPKQPAFCAWLVRKQTSVPHPRDYDGYPAPPTCINLICGEGSVTATKIGLSRRLLSQQECLSTASPVCSYFASKRRQIKLHLLRSQLARCCSRARRSVVNGDVAKCCFTRFLLLADQVSLPKCSKCYRLHELAQECKKTLAHGFRGLHIRSAAITELNKKLTDQLELHNFCSSTHAL